jgi:hypothetical protein
MKVAFSFDEEAAATDGAASDCFVISSIEQFEDFSNAFDIREIACIKFCRAVARPDPIASERTGFPFAIIMLQLLKCRQLFVLLDVIN